MTRFRRSGVNWEGRPWVLAAAVDALAGEVEALWPDPHPADGTVASETHDAVNPRSDHRPYPYTGAGVVYALDAGEVLEDDGAAFAGALRQLRDPRTRYVIHEGRLFSSYEHAAGAAWEWRPYTGASTHPGHVHVSTYRTASAGPWGIASLVGDMALTRATTVDAGAPALEATVTKAIAAGVASEHTQPGGIALNDEVLAFLDRAGALDLRADLAALKKRVNQLAAGGGVTMAAVLAEIGRRLLA